MKRFVYIFMLISLLASCKDDCKMDNLGSYTFSAAELSVVPYRNSDSIIFTNLSGKDISFSLIERRSEYSGDNNKHYESSTSDNPDCPGDYYYTEANYTRLKGKGNNRISIDLSMTNPFQPNFRNQLYITVDFADSVEWFHHSIYKFDSLGLSQDQADYGILASTNDSIKIGPTMFYNVYELIYPVQPATLGYLKTVYYNTTLGVVGFKTSNEQYWWLK